ncbi:MAG: hypothetical protein WCB33_11175, partial [Bradyrhizobium sp.]
RLSGPLPIKSQGQRNGKQAGRSVSSAFLYSKVAVFKKLFNAVRVRGFEAHRWCLGQGPRDRTLEYDSYPTSLLRRGFCRAQ